MNVLQGTLVAGPAGTAMGVVNWLQNEPYVPARELLKSVKPGDLIEFDRILYMHWAMYSDEEGMIFNIPAESKNENKVTIKKERLLDVAGSSGVRVNNQEKVAARFGYRKRSRSEAVAAAKAYLEKTVPYDFTSINCEYYSTKWLYGHGFSTQVNQAKAGAGLRLGTIIGGPFGAILGFIMGGADDGQKMTVTLDTTGEAHLCRKNRR